MGFFDFLSKKKNKKQCAVSSPVSRKVEIKGGSYSASVHSDGRITGEMSIEVPGIGLITRKINTSTAKLHEQSKQYAQEREALIRKYGTGNIIDLDNGMIRVRKKYLMNKYIKNAVIPEDIFWMEEDIVGYITIPKSRLDEMEETRKSRLERDHKLAQCASLNNKGIAFEKEGKITEAIKVYEENISSDSPFPAPHAFDRLMILYRKQKDYDNEIRIIKKAMKVFPKEPKYRERLAKAEKLKNSSASVKGSNTNAGNHTSEYWL